MLMVDSEKAPKKCRIDQSCNVVCENLSEKHLTNEILGTLEETEDDDFVITHLVFLP